MRSHSNTIRAMSNNAQPQRYWNMSGQCQITLEHSRAQLLHGARPTTRQCRTALKSHAPTQAHNAHRSQSQCQASPNREEHSRALPSHGARPSLPISHDKPMLLLHAARISHCLKIGTVQVNAKSTPQGCTRGAGTSPVSPGVCRTIKILHTIDNVII